VPCHEAEKELGYGVVVVVGLRIERKLNERLAE
jgi:hypothetical protein